MGGDEPCRLQLAITFCNLGHVCERMWILKNTGMSILNTSKVRDLQTKDSIQVGLRKPKYRQMHIYSQIPALEAHDIDIYRICISSGTVIL